MAQDITLSWGALQFAGPSEPITAYRLDAMADGTNFDNPEPIVEVVKSLLSDGSLAVLEGWDNREVPIRLRISGPAVQPGPALAAAESVLMGQILMSPKPALTWVPPAAGSATCVFDVVAAKLERDVSDGWDVEEALREYRYYLLTLTCLPFARTEETVVVPALAPPPTEPTTVPIDACDSLTGWSAIGVTAGPLLGDDDGDSYVSGYATDSSGFAGLLRTDAVSMSTTPYLRLVLAYGAHPNPPVLKADGVALPLLARFGGSTGGLYEHYYEPPASFETLAIELTHPGALPSINVFDISRTNVIIGAGTTNRQATRTATVAGSAPTQAAIRLYDATPAPLGSDVLVYTTSNSDWVGSLRPFVASSALPDSDEAMVSGARNTLAAPMVIRVPASRFTGGSYALMARLSAGVAGDLTWQARVVDSEGDPTVGSSIVATGTIALDAMTDYEVVVLGRVALPVVAVEGDQLVEITLTGTADMSIDEVWPFGLDDGVLTWLRDDDALTWIEIRSPELGAARPSVYGGHGAVGTDPVCIDWKAESFGTHRFDPGLMQVFTVTTSSLVSQSELELYPRFHSHVEDDAA